MDEEIRKTQLIFYCLFGLLSIFVVATPHIILGHAFVSEKLAQSLVLLAEVCVGYALYRAYKKKIQKFSEEKDRLETRMTNSYSYIGKINNLINLFKEFGKFFPYDEIKAGEKESIYPLLQHMLVSVAKTEAGFLRIIDARTARTVAEFSYAREGTQFLCKLSNVAILGGKSKELGDEETVVIESFYPIFSLRCVLSFKKEEGAFDRDTLQALLSHVHLLYLAHHTDRFFTAREQAGSYPSLTKERG